MQCLAASEPTPQPAGSETARPGRKPHASDAQDAFAAVLAMVPLPGGPVPGSPAAGTPDGAEARPAAPAEAAGLAPVVGLAGAGPGDGAPGIEPPPAAGREPAGTDAGPSSDAAQTPPEGVPEADRAASTRIATAAMSPAGAASGPAPDGTKPDPDRLSDVLLADAAARSADDAHPDAAADARNEASGDGAGDDATPDGAKGKADGGGGHGEGADGGSRGRRDGGDASLAAPAAGERRDARFAADADGSGAGRTPAARDNPASWAGARVVETVVRSAGGPIEVTLAPEELGRVHMAIRDQGGALSLSLTADRPETLDLMRRHADLLEKDLRLLGYGSISFQFGQGGSGSHTPALPQPPFGPDLPSATEPAPARPASGRVAKAGASLDIRL